MLRPKGGEKGSHQTSIGDIARGNDDDVDEEDDGSGSVLRMKL